jgi:ParB family chromosome partitioning protein
MIFDEDDLQRLRESIDEVGILVPLTVWEASGEIRLIDGERRLTCALELGLERVPCYVVDGVNETEELEWMFSTHMMREQWEDGPVARALRDLASRLGGWDNETMKAVTGLSSQRLNYFRALAESPPEILDRVIDESLPANLVADSVLRVANPMRNELPDIAAGRTDAEFIETMVEKRDAGALPDVVSLRDLRTMIRIAAEEAETDEEADEIKAAIDRVITEPSATIEEAYDDTVGTRVAAETYERAAERFQRSTEHVVRQVERTQASSAALADRLERLGKYLIEVAGRLRSSNGA